jgi:hypothetical protein
MLDTTVATPSDAHNRSDHHRCIRVQGTRWAVLATYPQAEPWAESNLRQRGYNPFLPRYAARQRDRVTPTLTHVVLRPLFAGYIFVQHDPADPWRPIRYCPGVRANLLGGNGIQYANAADISALEATEAARRSLAPENRSWAPGTPCSPRKGYALEGLPGVVLSVHRDQATVAIMLFGHLRRVTMDANCLVARDG